MFEKKSVLLSLVTEDQLTITQQLISKTRQWSSEVPPGQNQCWRGDDPNHQATQKAAPHLWHLLSDFGQVLPFLADDETVEPGGSRDGGDGETVGLGNQETNPWVCRVWSRAHQAAGLARVSAPCTPTPVL